MIDKVGRAMMILRLFVLPALAIGIGVSAIIYGELGSNHGPVQGSAALAAGVLFIAFGVGSLARWFWPRRR